MPAAPGGHSGTGVYEAADGLSVTETESVFGPSGSTLTVFVGGSRRRPPGEEHILKLPCSDAVDVAV